MKNIFIKIYNKYVYSEKFHKITINTGWLLFDKIFRMGVSLFVGVWVARYLGPQQYGMWNYAMAFATLFGTLATLGLDHIIIRDIVKDPSSSNKLLGTSFVLKLIAGIVTLMITIISFLFINQKDTLTLWLVIISSAGFVFQCFFVIDYYFQANVISKYTVYAQNIAFVIIAIIKIYLIVNNYELIYFSLVGFAEIILTSIFLVVYYKKHVSSLLEWKYESAIAKTLLKDGWPLILAGVAVMIYMRIDQVMIGSILGNTDVGIYSAAIRISEIWYFIPAAIASSLYPTIIESKNKGELFYNTRLQKLYDSMSLLGYIVAIIVSFFSGYIIKILFGIEYAAASTVLSIHIWIGTQICISTIHGKWLLVENLQSYSLIYTVIGAVVNVVLNLILISKIGLVGAAIATLFAQYLPWIAMAFLPKARKNAIMMVKALFILFRLKSFFKNIG